MADSYTRKSSFTRTQILAGLGIDPIFSALTTAQKNQLIDEAVQKVASLRNSLGKEDYKFDTTNLADILSLTYGFSKYLFIVAISNGTTYNGTLYEADTVIVERNYQVTLTDDPPLYSGGKIHVTSSSQFTAAVQLIQNQWTRLYSTTDPNDIEITLPSGWGVYSVLIYEV